MQYQSRTYDPVSGEVISQRGGVPLPGTEPHNAVHGCSVLAAQ
ncbi:MAG TPA: hypothetical protein VKI00_08920 [Mycobacterium sp.]|jgi:hypothetical protein|nr:hypothetical protein [Mycobacterium sp.]HME75754.1 hypothetical protein [Mycobacterium sp.]